MKRILTLAIILLSMQSCTDELPEPEKRHGKDNYDRVEMEEVRDK